MKNKKQEQERETINRLKELCKKKIAEAGDVKNSYYAKIIKMLKK